MIQKEINEIRRRLTGERSCISKIYGCFVNQQKEIISRIESSMALMPQGEKDRFLSVIKRSLSGGIGKNLTDITFTTAQVADSAEHKLLMKLRDSMLSDEEAREKLLKTVIEM